MPLPIQFSRLLTGAPRPGDAAAAVVGPCSITAFDQANNAEAVAALARACRGEEGPHAGHFLPAGVLADLAGRPGRAVQAWLAWPHAETGWAGQGAPAAGRPARHALGLVTLVVVPAVPPRASIGWLLVAPAARRRGVARALVAMAVAAAHAAGAERVTAETLPTWPAAAAFWRAAGFSEHRPGTDR
jgi:ribosomal protein S18 acetylase RimI-like enzyme